MFLKEQNASWFFHDLSPIHFPELYPLRKQFWHWQQRIRKQAKEAGQCIAVSTFTAQDIKRTFLLPDHAVKTIYSGINPYYIKLPKEDVSIFRKDHNLQNPFLLFVGVLEPRKNIGSVIASFNALKERAMFSDLKLVIAGKNGWLCDTIFKEANHSRWKDDIIFWGETSFETLRFLYNACEVFVYPSFFEGFGFPPLEAQRSGAPVIVSNRSSFPEIVGESGILVDPWSIDEQVSALDLLLSHQSIREEYIKRGYENAKRFSWTKTAKEVLDTFKSLDA